MANLPYATRDLVWIADSKELLSGFPPSVKRTLGFALRQVQNGETPKIAKPLKGFGVSVYELRTSFRKDTYRVVYVIKLRHSVYVLDCFVKKSKTKSKTPKEVNERLKERLKCAKTLDAEQPT